MKRKIILSIALVLSVASLSLIKSDSTVNAEPPQKFFWDTGVVKLGAYQILRLTVNIGSGNDTIAVRFRGMEYVQSVCGDGMCKSFLTAQNNSTPLLLMPGEAASYDRGDTAPHEVRSMVVSNSRDARVTAAIINVTKGETTSQIILANTEGDIH